MTPEDSRKEREARSVALEKAYVHDVYDQISLHLRGEQGRPWPKVSKFLEDLEPGSLIADVGKELSSLTIICRKKLNPVKCCTCIVN